MSKLTRNSNYTEFFEACIHAVCSCMVIFIFIHLADAFFCPKHVTFEEAMNMRSASSFRIQARVGRG